MFSKVSKISLKAKPVLSSCLASIRWSGFSFESSRSSLPPLLMATNFFCSEIGHLIRNMCLAQDNLNLKEKWGSSFKCKRNKKAKVRPLGYLLSMHFSQISQDSKSKSRINLETQWNTISLI